jgi:uncharacterized protein YceK
MLRALAAFAAVALSGCATVMEGTAQSVAVSTNPAGASCTIDRASTRLGAVPSTPGSIHMDKSKNDLTVTCTKQGYQPATISQSPRFQGTTFGNIILGGGIGAIVDAASGANYEYPAQVNLSLSTLEPVPAAAAVIVPCIQPVISQ